MEFLIRENLTLSSPDLRPAVAESMHGSKESQKRIVVEIAAIHEGITKNFNKYTAEELERATSSWMTPYPKPLILNHDLNSEPIGRMVNSEYQKDVNGEGFIKLRVAILDPEAAAKVMDGRYLTGSVGGMPTAAICSICYKDVISSSRESDGCGHQRGQSYDEKICVYEHRGISFHEYSFVNAPGDSKSVVQGQVTESEDLSIYSIDFAKASVEKLTESDGFVNIREMMSEVDANKLYLDVAFGSQYSEEQSNNMMFKQNNSTIAKESNSSDLERTKMTQEKSKAEVAESEDEDILDVADRLTSDLSEKSDQDIEEDIDNPEEKDIEEDAKKDEALPDESTSEVTEDVTEAGEDDAADKVEPEVAAAEEVAEDEVQEIKEDEADSSESDTKAESKDLDSEEKVEDKDESEAIAEEEVSDTGTEESEEVTESEIVSNEEEVNADSEDGASVAELQARVESLEEENTRLKDQNSKMKTAIHAELATKVVEAKIAVGHLGIEDRDEAIEEHKARSASSLAYALVDIRSFAEKNNFQVNVVNGTIPSLNIQAVVVGESLDSDKTSVEGEDQIVEEVVEKIDPQEILVEKFTALLTKGQEKFLQSNNIS